jgi:hypothetical protein
MYLCREPEADRLSLVGANIFILERTPSLFTIKHFRNQGHLLNTIL